MARTCSCTSCTPISFTFLKRLPGVIIHKFRLVSKNYQISSLFRRILPICWMRVKCSILNKNCQFTNSSNHDSQILSVSSYPYPGCVCILAVGTDFESQVYYMEHHSQLNRQDVVMYLWLQIFQVMTCHNFHSTKTGPCCTEFLNHEHCVYHIKWFWKYCRVSIIHSKIVYTGFQAYTPIILSWEYDLYRVGTIPIQ